MHVLLSKFFCALPGVFLTMCVNIVMIRSVVFEFYANGQSQSVSHVLSALIIQIPGHLVNLSLFDNIRQCRQALNLINMLLVIFSIWHIDWVIGLEYLICDRSPALCRLVPSFDLAQIQTIFLHVLFLTCFLRLISCNVCVEWQCPDLSFTA